MRTDCDGIVIAAPAPLHAPLAQKAFAAGKHVYVEKPLAMTLGEADAIIEASVQAGKHLMVGHLLQYHPVFARLRDIVRNGELGNLQYLYSNRLSLGKIRAEEDVVWSFAPHDISMILSLAGNNVKTVRCEAADIIRLASVIWQICICVLKTDLKAMCHVLGCTHSKNKNLL